MLKVRSQSKIYGQTDYVKLARTIIREQGASSMYKGYLCTLLRDVPAFAVYFGIFEIGLHRYTTPADSLTKKLSYQLLFGSIAGILSWWITYPFDIVKTVIQTTDHPISIRRAFMENYRRYGLRFYTKGLLATSIKAVPMEAT